MPFLINVRLLRETLFNELFFFFSSFIGRSLVATGGQTDAVAAVVDQDTWAIVHDFQSSDSEA